MTVKFLESFKDELENYFPENFFVDFEIFVPKYLPQSVSEANSYKHKEIQTIAKQFDLNPSTLNKEWTDLLISMIELEG